MIATNVARKGVHFQECLRTKVSGEKNNRGVFMQMSCTIKGTLVERLNCTSHPCIVNIYLFLCVLFLVVFVFLFIILIHLIRICDI